MGTLRSWAERLAQGTFAIGLLANGGCLGFCHRVEPPVAELRPCCEHLPKPARDRVYVFLLNGCDPLDYANLTGVRERLVEAGYNKVYYGQVFHIWHYRSEIRRLHCEQPAARFVVVGFGAGNAAARELARELKKDDVTIDLFAQLSPTPGLEATTSDLPHVTRNLKVRGTRSLWLNDQLFADESAVWVDATASGTPSHAAAVETLVRELSEVASRVPVVERDRPTVPEEAPAPRRVTSADEWDFLKPAPRTSVGKPAEPPRAGTGEER